MTAEETGALTMSGAAFEAFRKRERGGVLTQASIGFTLILLIGLGASVALLWPVMSEVVSWYMKLLGALPKASAAPLDPTVPPPVIPPPPASIFMLIPAYFLILFFVYVTTAAYEAACLRWMVRGEAGGAFFGLNLSRETWRIYLGYWLWFCGYFVANYGIQYGALAVGGIIGFAAGALGGGNTAVGMFAGIAGGVIFAIVGLCIYAWAAVRFAPAAATSVALRRFAFFDAWRVSKDKFWPMFGSFFLVFLINFSIILVIEGAAFGLILAQLWPISSATFAGPALMAVLTRPINIAVLASLYLIVMIAGWLFYLSMFGINARVVKIAIQEGRLPEANPSAVF